MKTFVLASVLLLLAASAVAQWHEDNLGLYMNPAYDGTFCGNSHGTGVKTVFVVGRIITSPTVKAFEFKAWFTGPVLEGSLTLAEGGIDLGTRAGEHVVAFYDPEPVAPNGNFLLGWFEIFVSDVGEPTYGYLGPIYFHSLPEPRMAYLDGEDLELIKELRPSTGDPTNPDAVLPVLILNGDCEGVVPSERMTFGEVKALYR